MRYPHLAFFLTVILLVYACVNYYLFRRTGQALEGLGGVRSIVLWAMAFFILAYPLGRLSEYVFRNPISGILVVIGSLYLGVMLYAFLLSIVIDTLRLISHYVRHFPPAIMLNPPAIWSAVAAIAVVTIGIGHAVTLRPHLRTCAIEIAKNADGLKELNIIAIADMHLGTVVGTVQLKRIAGMIHTLKPDLVLLAGDVFDEDVSEPVECNTAAILGNIKTRFGVFAVTGNHEYYAGVEKAVSHLARANVTVLQDSVVRIADAFYLIGRKDLAAERLGNGRKSLDELLINVDRRLPLVLMDHQPFHLESAERCGIDLQLTGHTHNGQLFPLNLFYGKIYELPWGYMRKGNTHIVVSCGAGTWGPPVRTNSLPEVVQIRVTFKD